MAYAHPLNLRPALEPKADTPLTRKIRANSKPICKAQYFNID
tara:strand:- start:540 stop:665 length:126 start_codon:yes stop_codon:yes gene_type:complete